MENDKCPVCGGSIISSNTTFTVDDGNSLVVIRNTPAMVCSQCGEEWIGDDVAEQLEEIVSDAISKKRTIEVLDYNIEDAA